MADKKTLTILKKDVDEWNRWRKTHTEIKPDLRGANLRGANLRGARLRKAHLSVADLGEANLRRAHLREAYLFGAVLSDADLRQADLSGADLSGANLRKANLHRAHLRWTNLSGTNLYEAELTGASVGYTTFGDNDLIAVKGLETVDHDGPSTIGIDTIYKSKGNIPESFLDGAGVPESFIKYMRALTVEPLDFNSCFISYSHEDEEFSDRLHADLKDNNVRVWYAPEEMKGGEKIHEQIDRAIRVNDKLLLVISEHSMKSPWVAAEIYAARDREVRENRRILFPIRLVDMEKIRDWKLFDGDKGQDLAREIREYFLPDFQDWATDHDKYKKALNRLLEDLKKAPEEGVKEG